METKERVYINLAEGTLKGYCKAKDFKRQIANLKEVLCPNSS